MAEANAQAQTGAAGATEEVSEFGNLLKKHFKPQNDARAEAIKSAVQTLAAQALVDTALVSDDAVRTIESMIAEIDKRMSKQIDLIMHHEEFRKLEGAWRGLHHLVNNTETDETLKIRVMNVSKKDLDKTQILSISSVSVLLTR